MNTYELLDNLLTDFLCIIDKMREDIARNNANTVSASFAYNNYKLIRNLSERIYQKIRGDIKDVSYFCCILSDNKNDTICETDPINAIKLFIFNNNLQHDSEDEIISKINAIFVTYNH